MSKLLEAGFSLERFTESMRRYLHSIMQIQSIDEFSEGEMNCSIIGIVLLECSIEHHKNFPAVISDTFDLEMLVNPVCSENRPEVYVIKVDFSVTGDRNSQRVSMAPPGFRLYGKKSFAEWNSMYSCYYVALDRDDWIGTSPYTSFEDYMEQSILLDRDLRS